MKVSMSTAISWVVAGILQIGAWGSIWLLLFAEVLLQLPCKSSISKLDGYPFGTPLDTIVRDLGEPRAKLETSFGFGVRYISRTYHEICSDIPITVYLNTDERLTGIRLGRREPQSPFLDWVLVVNGGFMLGWLGAMVLARNERRYILPQSLAAAAMLTLDAVFVLPDLMSLSHAVTSVFWLLVTSALLMLAALVQVMRTVVSISSARSQGGNIEI